MAIKLNHERARPRSSVFMVRTSCCITEQAPCRVSARLAPSSKTGALISIERRLNANAATSGVANKNARVLWELAQCASVIIVVHVLVPFMPQMFRPFLPFLDTTLRVLSGALVVPAMFGTFPVVARIVEVIVGVRVLPAW